MPSPPFPPDWQALGGRADWERVLAGLLHEADAAIASHGIPAMQQASQHLQVYQQQVPAFAPDLGATALSKVVDIDQAIMAQSASGLKRIAALQPHLETIADFAAAAAAAAHNQALLRAHTESMALASRLHQAAPARAGRTPGGSGPVPRHVAKLLKKPTRRSAAPGGRPDAG